MQVLPILLIAAIMLADSGLAPPGAPWLHGGAALLASLAPFALMAGAAGWIWGAANAMPRETVQLYDLIASGRHGEALALWQRMEPANLFFWDHVYNVAVKQATNHMGRPVGPCRKPALPLSDADWAALKAALEPLR